MKFSYIHCHPVADFETLVLRMQRIAELGYCGIGLVATHPLGFPLEDLLAAVERTRLPVVSLLSGRSCANEGHVTQLIERVSSPTVNPMLDTIHMNIEEHSMLDTIRRYGQRIGHFHLCESNGGISISAPYSPRSMKWATAGTCPLRFIEMRIGKRQPNRPSNFCVA